MSNQYAITLFCFVSILTAKVGAAPQDPPELTNGSFDEWKDDMPVGWKKDLGVTGPKPSSKISRGPGPSLVLSGDRSTRSWNFVHQTLSVKPGDTLRLRFEAKSVDVRREDGQYDNCYVGVFLNDSGGKTHDRKIVTINSAEYVPGFLAFRVPSNITQAQAAIFLSKTGALHVKNLALEVLEPEDSFELLVQDMDRHYSYFEHKQIDWPELTTKYRARATGARDADQFVEVIGEMLAEMGDGHIWIKHKGKIVSKNTMQPVAINFDFREVNRDLETKKEIGNLGVTGRTSDGFGYVRITTLSRVSARDLRRLISATRELFDAPGIIVDLRSNGGGDEPTAQQVARLFLDEAVIYGRQKFRAGFAHGEFFETQKRVLQPTEGNSFTKPIVCLIGPRAVSSAEGFAMMMKAIPHCMLIGQPTRGSSGNPAPIQLPNGVDVFYSRWVSMLPDGTPIEGAGVPPDEEVEHENGSDRTYERAVEILKEKS